MALAALCGFEMASLPSATSAGAAEPGGWYSNGAGAEISTGTVRTGARSIRIHPASNNNANVRPYANGVPGSGSYIHFAMYVATLPSVTRQITNYGGYANLRLTPTGALEIRDGATLIGTTSGTPFSTPGWHWVGFLVYSATTTVLLQVDGNDEVSGTMTSSSSGLYLGCGGAEASAIDFYIDDFVVDTAGFLDPSKVALLLPISDNSVNTSDWKLGDGSGTTNYYEAVNNIPPAGVASANETTTSNIEAVANGGGNPATFNLTAYSTAGVASGDTVLGVQAIIRHGEDITTGSKSCSRYDVTNPDFGGNNPFGFGDGLGAHATDDINGLWVNYAPIYAYPPSSLTTSPTISVTRTAAESRVACIDFMGMYVAWTPAAASKAPPFISPTRRYAGLLPR